MFGVLFFMLVMFFVFVFFVLQSIAFFVLLERHLLGLSHNRYGPKKTSFFGFVQAIMDGIKLINKEQVLLFNCSSGVFLLVTILNFLNVYIEFMCLPYCFSTIVMSWGYLMVMILLGLNLFCLLVGGIFSKSKYAYLGSMRCVVSSVSYEVQFNMNLLMFMLYYKSFAVMNILNLGITLYFFTFFFSLLVELSRTPFDYSESESDLVSGFNVEYSSVGFVLIFLKEYGSLLFMSVLLSVIFSGGAFLITMLVFCLIILARSSFPRFRIDNLMGLMWLMTFFHVVVGLWCTYHFLYL